MCLCPHLPRVPTRTALHILQHPRESKHPFGTARLVGLSLPNAQVHVVCGGLAGDLQCRLELPDDAAVLYPHADAVDLASMPAAEHPSTLVVLDATWAHARRLYKHNPWLQRLRHVRLHPERPSNYRIRKEPRPDFVSTLEAIVGALRIVEPETPGVDTLLASFDHMIDRQLGHLDVVPQHGRHKQKRQRPSRRLSPLLEAPDLLVVYGESALIGGVADGERELLQWTAVRVDDGEVFEVLLRPRLGGPRYLHLGHLRIDAAALDGGVDLDEARRRFAAFAGGRPALAAWTGSTLDYGEGLGVADWPRVLLKVAWCNLRNRSAGVLEQVLAAEGLAAPPLGLHGRAQHRLANALAVARWLRAQRQCQPTGVGAGKITGL